MKKYNLSLTISSTRKKAQRFLIAGLFSVLVLSGCGESTSGDPVPDAQNPTAASVSTDSSSKDNNTKDKDATSSPATDLDPSQFRDNTPECLVPTAPGSLETHNEVASIDYSNTADGYVSVRYTGSVEKIKGRVTGSDEVVYTYDLKGSDYQTFPLTSGAGDYDITVYENIEGTNYTTCLHETVTASSIDEFAPYLYPNQYVSFSSSSKAIAKGKELAYGAGNDLDVVSNIYNYIIENIEYDYDFAASAPTSYISDIDATLASGMGICQDYAALMASMLRSQRIPTRLEVGYAQDAYHAWISVYIPDIGWINDMIEFDGSIWTLMDPTFGANTSKEVLKKFIGDGTNYTLQKIY